MFQYSPTFFAGNPITILSGRILANSGNRTLLISTFSLEIWISFVCSATLIAIWNSIQHKEYSKWTFDLVDIVDHIFKLLVVSINQSNQFGNICCVKHLIVNSITIIALFIVSLFFNSEILSRILFRPLVEIGTMDDLVDDVKLHQDVNLISDKLTSTWSIMQD